MESSQLEQPIDFMDLDLVSLEGMHEERDKLQIFGSLGSFSFNGWYSEYFYL